MRPPRCGSATSSPATCWSSCCPGAHQRRGVPRSSRRLRRDALARGRVLTLPIVRPARARRGRADRSPTARRSSPTATSRCCSASASSRCRCSPACSSRSSRCRSVPRWLAYASPLWHGVDLSRAATLGVAPAWSATGHVLYLLLWVRRRLVAGPCCASPKAAECSDGHPRPAPPDRASRAPVRRSASVAERNVAALRSAYWVVLISGFFEPVLYLFSIGVGVGALVGDLDVPDRGACRLRGVRRAGDARLVGDERRARGDHLQLLREDEVHEAVRRRSSPRPYGPSRSRSASWRGRCCAARSTPPRSWPSWWRWT